MCIIILTTVDVENDANPPNEESTQTPPPPPGLYCYLPLLNT